MSLLSQAIQRTKNFLAPRITRSRAALLLAWHRATRRPVADVARFAYHVYSQGEEDGMTVAIFALIGTTNRFYVEFGVESGSECNTRLLRERYGWQGLLMDGGYDDPSINLRKQFITAENIEQLFATYEVPPSFDLLSIDIDGNDYWVWRAIANYRPRVVIVEYNACLPYSPSVTIPYDPKFAWDQTDYYGASLSALVGLGRQKGYTLIATDPRGVNAFFVLDELVARHFSPAEPPALYRPPGFVGTHSPGHTPDPLGRPWLAVDQPADPPVDATSPHER